MSKVFLKDDVLPNEIIENGEKALLILYNSKGVNSLTVLRHQIFLNKVATHVDPSSLPPTSAAAKFHSFRVYFQVSCWKTPMNTLTLHIGDGKKKIMFFFSVQTDISPAPENLLKILRCNFQSDCNSRSCTYRKNDLKCSSVCGHCRGVACLNSIQVEEEN